MKSYFKNLSAKNWSAKTWMWLAIPAAFIAYPIVTLVGPAVVRAVVPEAVRSVLSLI
jgi:hypothetical protein